MKPLNLKEFIIKSIVTRNAHRDAMFDKYKAYYEDMHCCVCSKELYNSSLEFTRSSYACSKCAGKACYRVRRNACCIFVKNYNKGSQNYYLCMKCQPSCDICKKKVIEWPLEFHQCRCGAIACSECFSDNWGDKWCIKCAPSCHICTCIDSQDIMPCVNCKMWTCELCINDDRICDSCHE